MKKWKFLISKQLRVDQVLRKTQSQRDKEDTGECHPEQGGFEPQRRAGHKNIKEGKDDDEGKARRPRRRICSLH